MLVTPGAGVYTVNTAKERKEELHELEYQTSHIKEVQQKWEADLERASNYQKAMLLGLCTDCGGGILRGANWGPLFLRLELLKLPGCEEFLDLGDIRVIPHLLHDKYLNQETLENCRQALYQDHKAPFPVSPLSIAENVLSTLYTEHKNPRIFGIGGDHSVSYPLTKTYLKRKHQQGIKTAIIHFDAHTDLLVERLGIDLCFGSWCTHILDLLPNPNHLIQIGIRSSGKPKEHWEKKFGIKQHWAHEITDTGPEKLADDIIENLKNKGVQELYVSFDIDAIDSQYAGATGTPEPNGLTPDQPMIILKKLTSQFPITGADMVEIAPFLNTSDKINPEPDSTLAIGAALSNLLIEELNR